MLEATVTSPHTTRNNGLLGSGEMGVRRGELRPFSGPSAREKGLSCGTDVFHDIKYNFSQTFRQEHYSMKGKINP